MPVVLLGISSCRPSQPSSPPEHVDARQDQDDDRAILDPETTEEAPLEQLRDTAYSDAERGLERADLYFAIPDPSRPEIALAPILVHRAANPPGATRTAEGTGDKPVQVESRRDTTKPDLAVRFFEDVVSIEDRSYARCVYWWRFPAPRSPEGGDHVLQVVFDTRGFPALVELIEETSGIRRVFLSKSLEEAAQKEHTEPLAGRRRASEASLESYPDVVVADVFSGGPIPLGTFVYLDDRAPRLVASLCRCQSPRIEQIASSRSYRLIESSPRELSRLLPHVSVPTGPRIAEGLRLPSEF